MLRDDISKPFCNRSSLHLLQWMQVIRLALQDAGVAPAALAALEMHGTGTSLGDPIEVGAAATVLSEGRSSQGADVLGLSAVKNILGHSEPAAGAAGMFRSMQRCALLLRTISSKRLYTNRCTSEHLAKSACLVDWGSPAVLLVYIARGYLFVTLCQKHEPLLLEFRDAFSTC